VRLRGVGNVVAAVVAASIVLFALLSFVASWRVDRARQGWQHTLGSREAILRRFPSREANAGALRLERLAARLGIELAPAKVEGRDRPSPEARRAYDRVRLDVIDTFFLDRLRLVEPERSPEAVRAFMDEHREELDAVLQSLRADPAPQWELQLEELDRMPVPSLLAQIHLQRLLLTGALTDRDRAWTFLEASWQLNRALRDEPILIEQRVAAAIMVMQAGVLRRLGETGPPQWRARLFEHDYRASLLDALRVEGWLWTEVDSTNFKTPSTWDAWTRLNTVERWIPKPTVGVFRGLVRPYADFSVASVADELRRRLDNLGKVKGLCDYDLGEQDADLAFAVPKWNMFSSRLTKGLERAVRRIARLELELELTGKLLDLRAGRVTDRIEQSAACPADRFRYETTPSGAASLEFSRELSWPESIGLFLPTQEMVATR
jgi:hypothetical protein